MTKCLELIYKRFSIKTVCKNTDVLFRERILIKIIFATIFLFGYCGILKAEEPAIPAAPLTTPASQTGSVIPVAAPVTAPQTESAIPPAPLATSTQTESVIPPAPLATPAPQTDRSQFQTWVNNGIPPAPISRSLPKRKSAPTTLWSNPGSFRSEDLKSGIVMSSSNFSSIQSSGEEALVQSPPMSYRRSQQVMLNAAPPSSTPVNPDSGAAFNVMMQQNMPLTPQQVIKLRQLIDTSQRAASIPATVPPKPVSTTLMINLAPGATPPAIRLAQGYVTSLVFVDSTGSPWPIAAYDIGDPKATTIQWDQKSNILLVQAVSPYSDSNLVIRLLGLPTPVTLELVSGQRVVDYRTDIHVPGIGPNTKDLPTGTPLPNSANQLLLNVLDGVAPPGSKILTITGGDCQGWLLGDTMYLRTRLTVLSPGWIGRMTSPDGMYAYEIQRTSSVLVSQYGNPIELKVEGF